MSVKMSEAISLAYTEQTVYQEYEKVKQST